ncbi:MaoC family dehydratase N-terminal domain-containing protein [Camelimonas abortus]|uniref:MaoC family dehydratase N-terminal domain-containing protein n=1 Tax=Camelimonas abortus TaxID=1017184 RepID=A0ABV7LH47_9HYPH
MAATFAVDPQTLTGHVFPPQHAFVEPRRLRFFIETIGETSPVYHSAEAARAAGYRDIPVPPTYLFCLQGLDNPGSIKVLDMLGVDIGRILHGEQKFVYHRPACVGDWLTYVTRIAAITDKKGGALTMVTQETRVENGEGAHVADLTSTIVIRNPQHGGNG